jgi:hypothetical protein
VAKVNLKGRDHLGDLGRDGRIILKFLNKHSERETGLKWLRIGSRAMLL